MLGKPAAAPSWVNSLGSAVGIRVSCRMSVVTIMMWRVLPL
jgi:hypothetical protein